MNDQKKEWQVATLVSSRMVAKNIKSFSFALQKEIQFEPGQYFELRITTSNGFKPDRPYSVANAPEEKGILEFGVELLPQGEVSTPLFELNEGDKVEIRGPYGDDFIWNTTLDGPLYLIAGGSGLVPLISMLRHHIYHLAGESKRKIVCLTSAKNVESLPYRDELAVIKTKNPNITVVETFTGLEMGSSAGNFKRRIDGTMLKETFGESVSKKPRIYICGPTPFVVEVTKQLLVLGYDPHDIKTERFGS